MDQMINDIQLGSQDRLIIPGPYINQEPMLECSEADDFTQASNNRFYNVTEMEIEFIASQATAQSTKSQTKWAVKILTGKANYFALFCNI